MKWTAKLLVLYALAFVLVVVVALTMTLTSGSGPSVHSKMDPVSHSDYELHRSIGHTS